MFLSSIHSLRSYSFNFYAKWILGHLTNPLRCFLSVKIWQTINDSNTQQAPPELRKHFKNVNCKLWYSKTRKWKLIRHMAGGDLFFLKPFSFFFMELDAAFLPPSSSLSAVRSIDLIYDVSSQVVILAVVGGLIQIVSSSFNMPKCNYLTSAIVFFVIISLSRFFVIIIWLFFFNLI